MLTVVSGIDDSVPQCVQLVNAVVTVEWELVSTSVSLRELLVKSAQAV